MITIAIRITLCLLALTCLTAHRALAQTVSQPTATRADSDQTLKDILNEVRQLRADLLRLNINARRTQALLDRMKVQQEQVVRLTREVGNVRDELVHIRGRQALVKGAIETLEKQKSVGVASEGELKAITADLEELKQREQLLVEREPVLSAELDSTRASLAELNARLDELEREIATPPAGQSPSKKN